MQSTSIKASSKGFPSDFSFSAEGLIISLLLLVVITLLAIAIKINNKIHSIAKRDLTDSEVNHSKQKHELQQLDHQQLSTILEQNNHIKKNKVSKGKLLKILLVALLTYLLNTKVLAMETAKLATSNTITQPGVIITIILLMIPLLAGLAILIFKVKPSLSNFRKANRTEANKNLLAYLQTLSDSEIESIEKRKEALAYRPALRTLSGNEPSEDKKGLLRLINTPEIAIVEAKQKAQKRSEVDPALSKLVIYYLCSATIWLVFGTTIGEYLGIKFLAPEADNLSWLSFGRLRPVHTNAVFWGWASLAMLGLGHYVVPRVSNAPLFSLKLGWYALHLINFTVIAGTICLMAGINNGGGEYREYIWPVMACFAIALAIVLYNFLRTVASRTTTEIYISNWYIISAIIFTIVITIVAYVPYWQNGLGETIVQGYYMHQGVGMWFMLFTLGLIYYFLPQQLNRPIYSYSLGILAFWAQIVFYTTIGTHHFVFSAIPWWLQTVAIVGSVGMIIPVVAGTTNFLMTFRGAWGKLKHSYALPFFLVGIVFYFTGSLQGTAEAFRYTNLIWHFTDFTVAHSHITMYGIICFFAWACIYALIPRLTGKEAPQLAIGAHFWLALIGLLFYTVPLMYGSTLRGLMWMEGKPFMDSVVAMAPYWLWRAIGGSLMWLSHLIFAYNMYLMIANYEKKEM
ncbi:MAG: cytochrome oxidase subunit I [Chitinophagaceae bacterium]|nr:MAG: cytochrome oxidase subunit I [Chitinophagaceae bacterium]